MGIKGSKTPSQLKNAADRRTGRSGENRAARYLKRHGYRILERNWRNPFGEVDIIAAKGDVVAFVEVKARLTDAFGAPGEAVGRRRQERYVNAARCYFADREMDCVVRFDVIEVQGRQLNHIESAFQEH